MDPKPLSEDVVLLLDAVTAVVDRRVQTEVAQRSGCEVRHADGYVFQHLVVSELAVTDLADRLGVSQQAASKQIADLERRGLVERRTSPDDGRVRLVALSDAGRSVVEAARVARDTIAADIVELLGPRTSATLRRALGELADELGATELVDRRGFRPESAR